MEQYCVCIVSDHAIKIMHFPEYQGSKFPTSTEISLENSVAVQKDIVLILSLAELVK